MTTRISDFIFQNPVISLSATFSSAKEIDDFFAQSAPDVQQAWPLDMSCYGLKTRYLAAKVVSETWKEPARFLVQAELSDGGRKAIVEQEFQFGLTDNMIVSVNSVLAENNDYPRGMNIARRLSEKNFKFLSRYDKSVKPEQPSFIQVYASSEMTKKNIRTCGGYVWANNGFSFQNSEELIAARKAFQAYVRRRGITVSDKDLRLFTKPCHFAAYRCGVWEKVNGHFYRLGKAFLLQYSWHGIQKTSANRSVEHRYANAYHNETLPALRNKTALRQLSKNYRAFLRQSYKKNLLRKIAEKFKAYRRLFSVKMAQHRLR